jgi:hypothetical protein
LVVILAIDRDLLAGENFIAGRSEQQFLFFAYHAKIALPKKMVFSS